MKAADRVKSGPQKCHCHTWCHDLTAVRAGFNATQQTFMCVADDGALNLLFRSNAKAGELSIGWTVVAFTLLGCSLSVAAKKPGTLSKKELKNLAASKNPADQQQLAEYYKDKGRGLTTKSEEFAKQAEILATQPATIESKQGISCNCPSHFRYFSKLYAQEAAEAEAEAERRERLAQEYSVKKKATENK